jgi:dipeptide transport system substrate-binding protein
MLQLGWSGDSGDPDNFLNVLLSCGAVGGGSNYARWCQKEFNDLVVKASRETNLKKRTALYSRAQEIFKINAPWVTLAHAREYRAMAKSVTGFEISSLTGDYFYGVDK